VLRELKGSAPLERWRGPVCVKVVNKNHTPMASKAVNSDGA
jgi:hypothetical protein